MKTLNIRDATAPLSQYALSIDGEALVVLSRGRPLAAVVPLRGTDLETVAVSMSPWFQQVIRRSRQRQQREGGLTTSQLRRQLGLKSKRSK